MATRKIYASPHHGDKEKVRISKLSNRQLYEETLDLVAEDGSEFSLSRNNEITLEILKLEMEKRLADWLNRSILP